VAAAAGLFAVPAVAATPLSDAQLGAMAGGIQISITNRVSDQAGVAPVTDPLLVNSWGLSQGPNTALWVANNGTDSSTIYNATSFAKVPLNVSVPGAPTGTTYVGIPNAFNVTSGGKTGATVFAFATEGGQIEGWSPTVDMTHAIVAVDESAQGSIFKGLTLGATRGFTGLPNGGLMPGQTPFFGEKTLLYAADFAHGAVNVYDSNFNKVNSFTDGALGGYSPFNVQNLNGLIYVAFAKHEAGDTDETAGPGLGYVDVFRPDGTLVRRLVQNGPLNAPWGLVIAPASFGKFAGALLVGNFGDGKINAFDPQTGAFLGAFDDGKGDATVIDGLWALHSGPNGTITFSAGPSDESHGLVGSIAPVAQMWTGAEVATMAEMHR
jgi:uncharacterized protein (TIGR03118 family)